jgi:hypothetical protein
VVLLDPGCVGWVGCVGALLVAALELGTLLDGGGAWVWRVVGC